MKVEVIQYTAAKCPKVNIIYEGIEIQALLDLSSEDMLLHQSHFVKYLKPIISQSSSNETEAHSLFKLTAAADGQLPVSRYIKLGIYFLGLKEPEVEFVITNITTTSWTININQTTQSSMMEFDKAFILVHL